MHRYNRKDMKARYELFDRFALKDQKTYYEASIENNRKAAAQVNRYRAMFALLTGLAAAAAGLTVQVAEGDVAQILATIFAILAVILPALGAAFSTLADLYQWDKLTNIYEAALENLEVADSLSPVDSIPKDEIYWISLRSYAEGALAVMSDETAQWGQSIRTPQQLTEFVEEEQRRVARHWEANVSAPNYMERGAGDSSATGETNDNPPPETRRPLDPNAEDD